MADWIDRYRESVSWGDQIHADLLAPSNTVCCWFTYSGGRHYSVPGSLGAIAAAIATAQQALPCPGCAAASVLFLDKDSTAYQVEEACHLTAAAGVGCGFLEAQPKVEHYRLLERATEGTLEQTLLDLRGAVDDRLSCGPAEHPTPEETELAVLLEALEQLVILVGGTDG